MGCCCSKHCVDADEPSRIPFRKGKGPLELWAAAEPYVPASDPTNQYFTMGFDNKSGRKVYIAVLASRQPLSGAPPGPDLSQYPYTFLTVSGGVGTWNTMDCQTGHSGGPDFAGNYYVELSSLPEDPSNSEVRLLKIPYLGEGAGAGCTLGGSGRVYISLDKPLTIPMNPGKDGTNRYSYAAPDAKSTPERFIFYEFSADPTGNTYFANSTNVDFTSFGSMVAARTTDSSDIRVFGLDTSDPKAFDNLLKEFKTLARTGSSLYRNAYVATDLSSDASKPFLRFLAPKHADPGCTDWDAAIRAAFTALSQDPAKMSFTFDQVMEFKQDPKVPSSGSQLAFTVKQTMIGISREFTVPAPTTIQAAGCQLPGGGGPWADQCRKYLAAAINRGYLGDLRDTAGPFADPSSWYPGTVTAGSPAPANNRYAQLLHKYYLNHQVYAFDYDDVAPQGAPQTDSGVGHAQAACFTLTAEGASG